MSLSTGIALRASGSQTLNLLNLPLSKMAFLFTLTQGGKLKPEDSTVSEKNVYLENETLWNLLS